MEANICFELLPVLKYVSPVCVRINSVTFSSNSTISSDVLFNNSRDLRFAGADLRSREAFFLRKRVLQESLLE